MPNDKPRHWCFTYFPQESEDLTHDTIWSNLKAELTSTFEASSRIKYIVCQPELSQEGNLHLQGYAEFKRPIRRLAAATELGLVGAHLEARRGTQEEAIQYCEKQDSRLPDADPLHLGTVAPGRGKRSDLSSAITSIRETPSLRVLAEQHPAVFIKYHRGFEKIIPFFKQQSDRPVDVTIIWGPSGVGKTRFVFEKHPQAYFWPRPANSGNYAMGYTGQEVVCFDDFYSWLPYDMMLRLLDRYPMTVNTMGGVQDWNATTIFITSNQDPRNWYPNISNKDAFFRRVREIIHLTDPFNIASRATMISGS
jgi:hypothetical protein